MSEDKTKSLDLAIGQIDRQFGKGAVIRLGEPKGKVRLKVFLRDL
ncbi:MAG: hypothetical protein CM1200mP8_6780 [Chloroflexota bacterium]|nr:MAG: hypothetical protein CM1200mP8_6780 [Chloroflexota bacterium]